MKELIFITGNQHKADYLAMWLGMPVEHIRLDLDEIQSLDLREIAEHKVRQAFEIVKRPVLVEDVALTFTAMGRLPGPFIKWFLGEIGRDGLCKLADGLADRKAEAAIEYALYDGKNMKLFSGKTSGTIADEPRGDSGFGWNPIFIPDGSDKTYAEMDETELHQFSMRGRAIEKLRDYLQKL